MKIAEKLYTQGYISYPRTETNMFPADFDLVNLIEQQTQDQRWGGKQTIQKFVNERCDGIPYNIISHNAEQGMVLTSS